MISVNFNGKGVVPSKVVCVGKNYRDHVKEMGDARPPAHPVIFLKPNSAIANNPAEITVPSSLGLLHHEIELCLMIGVTGKDIAAAAVGIDLTLREIQSKLKKAGHPWEISKAFDNSAILGRFMPVDCQDDLLALDIVLEVNCSVKQSANTGEMIFRPEQIIDHVSKYISLKEGDIIMCGTPSGVGPLKDGDEVSARIKGLPELKFKLKR